MGLAEGGLVLTRELITTDFDEEFSSISAPSSDSGLPHKRASLFFVSQACQPATSI